MRKALLVKNTISAILALSFSTAMAAPPKKAQIDNEIQAMAANASKNSQARVEKTKKAKAKKTASKKAAVKQTPITQMANPATAAPPTSADTTAFERFEVVNPVTTSTSSIKTAAPQTATTSFSGSVGITVGKDSNATVEKTAIDEAPVTQGSFYELKPNLGYKGEILFGNFGARIKDWTNQSLSDNAKETQINADMGADYALGLVKATTKVGFENADSQWPDYLTGTNKGMPLRYFQSRISQSLSADLGQLNFSIDGSFTNRDFTTPYMDNSADHVLGQTIFEQDQRITQGSIRVGAKLAESFEIAVRPVMRHTEFLHEPARQTNGQKGGAALDPFTPRREVVRQEGNLDLVFKTARVNITPTFTFGNDSDEALGALDNTYRGGGLTAEVIIDPATSLKLAGSFNYREAEFDNWTFNGLNNPLPNGQTRRDVEKVTGASAGVNFTKNVGIALNYTLIDAKSNWEVSDMNYTQEIIGSTVTVSF